MPLIARGGGTSLSGQSIGAGIVVDFSKYLNRIVELDAASDARRASSRAWCWINSTRQRQRIGLQFGPDVATSNRANLGGMIGNNSRRLALDPAWQDGRSRR